MPHFCRLYCVLLISDIASCIFILNTARDSCLKVTIRVCGLCQAISRKSTVKYEFSHCVIYAFHIFPFEKTRCCLEHTVFHICLILTWNISYLSRKNATRIGTIWNPLRTSVYLLSVGVLTSQLNCRFSFYFIVNDGCSEYNIRFVMPPLIHTAASYCIRTICACVKILIRKTWAEQTKRVRNRFHFLPNLHYWLRKDLRLRASIHEATMRLTANSREASKPRD